LDGGAPGTAVVFNVDLSTRFPPWPTATGSRRPAAEGSPPAYFSKLIKHDVYERARMLREVYAEMRFRLLEENQGVGREGHVRCAGVSAVGNTRGGTGRSPNRRSVGAIRGLMNSTRKTLGAPRVHAECERGSKKRQRKRVERVSEPARSPGGGRRAAMGAQPTASIPPVSSKTCGSALVADSPIKSGWPISPTFDQRGLALLWP